MTNPTAKQRDIVEGDFMDAAYMIYEEKAITVPMAYDPPFFKMLLAYDRWDKQNNRFILPDNLKAGQYRNIFAGRPYVEVKNNGLTIINGFFERRWQDAMPVANQLPTANQLPATNHKPSINQQSKTQPLSATDRSCLNSAIPPAQRLSPSWEKKFKEELHSRKYSPQTIKIYVHFNRDFCRTLRKPVEQITEEDFKQYLAYLDTVKDLSSSSMNLAVSAVRFFYNNVVEKSFGMKQHRPRQDKRLPGVFSREEIEQLLNAEPNPKHRLLLMLVYSSGLRVSEVVVLKRNHIDFSRKILLVYGAKGRKDRFTLLADRAAAFLREYYEFFGITDWLFPGQCDGHLHIRSAQHIFDKAVRNANIRKNVTIHSLRHTFATHLLENGTDIKYIQTLLGYSHLKTTERYTHIARRSILQIRSPLDSGI